MVALQVAVSTFDPALDVLSWLGFVILAFVAVIEWRATRTRVRAGEPPARGRATCFTVFAVLVGISKGLTIVAWLLH